MTGPLGDATVSITWPFASCMMDPTVTVTTCISIDRAYEMFVSHSSVHQRQPSSGARPVIDIIIIIIIIIANASLFIDYRAGSQSLTSCAKLAARFLRMYSNLPCGNQH
jgi:hypothetical protein